MKFLNQKIAARLMVVVAAVVVVLVGVSRMSPETDRQKEDKEAADEALVAEYEQPEIAVVVPNDLSATLLFADEQAAYEASDFQNKVVAYVDDFLPVRTEPTRDSETIGKMYPGSVADVIERGEVWSKIRSGSVEGYIQNMYVCFDSEAEDIAILLGGEEELITAVSVEEEEAEKKAQEEAAAKRAAEEAARKAAQEAARQAEEERAAAQQEVTEAQTQAENTEETAAPAEEATVSPYYMELSEEDIYLIACIVDWEANSESYEGKLAVANVILNRVRSSAYPNTVSGVIYQRGQFGGVLDSSGNYSTRWQARLASGPRNDECITAARAAASGVNNVIGYLAFNGTAYCNLSSYRSYIIIGNHCFYQR